MVKGFAVGALAMLLFFAWLTAIRPAFTLFYVLAALLLLSWAWPRLAARRISLERSVEFSSAVVGDEFRETIEVRRTGWLPAPWVEVIDAGTVPGYQPGRVVSLGRGPARWVARGRFQRRGWARFGPTILRISEPFGLFTRQIRVDGSRQVLVYPRIWLLPEMLAPASQRAGDALRGGAWAEQPPESGGVREYTPGDAFNRIHWALSARHQSLMSKTFEQPLTADVWVVLDLHRGSHWGTAPDSTDEYAISLAASVAAHVHARGRQVGLIVNDAAATVLEPHRVLRQDRVILEYLAVAEADGKAPLHASRVWDRVRRLPRRALVVVTASPSPEWVDALMMARARGSTSLVYYIDASSFGGPASHASFDLGTDMDLFVVRKGDELTRLTGTRDALRLA
jgi:uncharacterized protein (DUF58 family)